jgi:hypothetical protein
LLETTAFEDRPNINDAFWHWFWDSKVVDENGDPLIVYHGTKKEFLGNSFVPSKWFGDIYFGDTEISQRYGNNIFPVYLRIENDGFERYKELVNGALINGHRASGREEMNNILKSEGYDGWIEPYQFVVFNPTQIKSVYNQGTWNPNDPDIMK